MTCELSKQLSSEKKEWIQLCIFILCLSLSLFISLSSFHGTLREKKKDPTSMSCSTRKSRYLLSSTMTVLINSETITSCINHGLLRFKLIRQQKVLLAIISAQMATTEAPWPCVSRITSASDKGNTRYTSVRRVVPLPRKIHQHFAK